MLTTGRGLLWMGVVEEEENVEGKGKVRDHLRCCERGGILWEHFWHLPLELGVLGQGTSSLRKASSLADMNFQVFSLCAGDMRGFIQPIFEFVVSVA